MTIGDDKTKLPYTEKCLALPDLGRAVGDTYLKMSCIGSGSVTKHEQADCSDMGSDFGAMMRFVGGSVTVENCDQPTCDYLLMKEDVDAIEGNPAQSCTEHDKWIPMLIDECSANGNTSLKITSCVDGKATMTAFAGSSTCEGESKIYDSDIGSPDLNISAISALCVICVSQLEATPAPVKGETAALVTSGVRTFERIGDSWIDNGDDRNVVHDARELERTGKVNVFVAKE